MWKCPKCGREFKRMNQGHYCGKAPEDVDAYIELQSAEAYDHLMELRTIVQRCVPGVKERIAWSMPRYEKDGHAISFAACKKHISLYIDTEILDIFKEQFHGFTIQKNAVYLPLDKALPIDVIENVIKQSFDEK